MLDCLLLQIKRNSQSEVKINQVIIGCFPIENTIDWNLHYTGSIFELNYVALKIGCDLKGFLGKDY